MFQEAHTIDQGWLKIIDQYQYPSNHASTPPLTQQQSTDNKLGLMSKLFNETTIIYLEKKKRKGLMVLCLVLEEQIKKKQGRKRKSSGHIRKCLLIRKYESLTSSLLASNPVN